MNLRRNLGASKVDFCKSVIQEELMSNSEEVGMEIIEERKRRRGEVQAMGPRVIIGNVRQDFNKLMEIDFFM